MKPYYLMFYVAFVRKINGKVFSVFFTQLSPAEMMWSSCRMFELHF